MMQSMFWRLAQTLLVCLVALVGFWILLLLDYDSDDALFAGSTFSVLVTFLWFFFYQRGYRRVLQEVVANSLMVTGVWLIAFAASQSHAHSSGFLNLVLALGLGALILPFLFTAVYSSQWQRLERSRRNEQAGWGDRSVGARSLPSGSEAGSVPRGNPDEFDELSSPYFPSQAYFWYWTNPLIISLGIVPGILFALLFALTFGIEYSIAGFGLGSFIVALALGYVVWTH